MDDVVGNPDWPCFCYDESDIIAAPHVIPYALKGYDVIKSYFGELPYLSSINFFFTQPSNQTYRDTHDWHRDHDDRKQMVMFTYGTDIVDPEDGAHRYERGSHLTNNSVDYSGYKPAPENVETVLGPAGTTFITDTYGIHMGIRPRKLRLLLWFRWCVSIPPDSEVAWWNRPERVRKHLLGDAYPSDPTHQEAIKLIVGGN